MRFLAVVALGLFTLISVPAQAGWQEVVNWCRNETSIPARSEVMLKTMPDGKLRGTRSAATLVAEARVARDRGDRNAAFEWLLHCVDHDPNAQNELRGNREASINAM